MEDGVQRWAIHDFIKVVCNQEPDVEGSGDLLFYAINHMTPPTIEKYDKLLAKEGVLSRKRKDFARYSICVKGLRILLQALTPHIHDEYRYLLGDTEEEDALTPGQIVEIHDEPIHTPPLEQLQTKIQGIYKKAKIIGCMRECNSFSQPTEKTRYSSYMVLMQTKIDIFKADLKFVMGQVHEVKEQINMTSAAFALACPKEQARLCYQMQSLNEQLDKLSAKEMEISHALHEENARYIDFLMNSRPYDHDKFTALKLEAEDEIITMLSQIRKKEVGDGVALGIDLAFKP